MQLTTKTGTEIEVSLDFDKVCEYEMNHPDWSIIGEVRDLGKTLRFSALNLLVSQTSYDGDFKDWAEDGLTVQNLTDVIVEGLNDLGFGSADAPSAQ